MFVNPKPLHLPMDFGEALTRLARVQKPPKKKRKGVSPETQKAPQGRKAKSG